MVNNWINGQEDQSLAVVMVHAGVAVHDIGTAYIDPDKYADSLSIVAFWPSC